MFLSKYTDKQKVRGITIISIPSNIIKKSIFNELSASDAIIKLGIISGRISDMRRFVFLLKYACSMLTNIRIMAIWSIIKTIKPCRYANSPRGIWNIINSIGNIKTILANKFRDNAMYFTNMIFDGEYADNIVSKKPSLRSILIRYGGMIIVVKIIPEKHISSFI